MSAPQLQIFPFAGLVRERMKERGLGLREVCREARVDPSFLSKVLSGKRSPPAEEAMLRRLAAVLELDAPRLIVSAGRIPAEWRRLWSDRELFHSVHRMAAGPFHPRPSVAEPGQRVELRGAPYRPKARPAPAPLPRVREREGSSFGEELL